MSTNNYDFAAAALIFGALLGFVVGIGYEEFHYIQLRRKVDLYKEFCPQRAIQIDRSLGGDD